MRYMLVNRRSCMDLGRYASLKEARAAYRQADNPESVIDRGDGPEPALVIVRYADDGFGRVCYPV